VRSAVRACGSMSVIGPQAAAGCKDSGEMQQGAKRGILPR
jgi:hypothetical protein